MYSVNCWRVENVGCKSVEFTVWSVKCQSLLVERVLVRCKVSGLEIKVSSDKCKMWSVECGVYRVECNVWNVKRRENNVKCGGWGERCGVTAWTVKCILFGVEIVQYKEWSVKCNLCSVERNVWIEV